MRFRFLAAFGPEQALDAIGMRAASAKNGCSLQVLKRSGFRLWTDDRTPSLAARDGTAAVVGLLVERSTRARQQALPTPLPSNSEFIERFWGGYALFATDSERAWRVLRDPSGTIPIYHRAAGEVELFATDAESLLLSGDEWRPDLHFVRHWLTFPFLRTARTGIAGVRELLPGTSRALVGGVATAWRPWQHVTPPRPALSFEEAAARLRETALQSIPLLVPEQGEILIELSGGLDSSIIAGVLAHAGRLFRAVTFATLAPDGDERRYARAVAAHCGIELAELVEEDAAPDLAAGGAISLRPPPNGLLRPYHRALSRHAAATGADLVLSGGGGDNVFASLNSASPAIDALRVRGPGAALGVLGDVAELHGCTWWRSAGAAIRKARHSRPPRPWRRETAFLRPDAVVDVIDPHPWFPSESCDLPGKAEHIRSIIGIHHFLDHGQAGTATLYPLLSQPVVELCVGIPSWLWLKGGRDRAVAREAFRGIVPDEILARRSKGRLQSMFMKGYMAGRRDIEELLLGGLLRSHGIIDAEAVRSYVRRPGQPRDAGYIRLLEMAAAETWLRSFG